jgi:hypothetical protein
MSNLLGLVGYSAEDDEGDDSDVDSEKIDPANADVIAEAARERGKEDAELGALDPRTGKNTEDEYNEGIQLANGAIDCLN